MSTFHLLSKSSPALRGEISVPGDKSISHRAIILGALAKGTTVIHNFLYSEDCIATLRAFEAMGVRIEFSSPVFPAKARIHLQTGSVASAKKVTRFRGNDTIMCEFKRRDASKNQVVIYGVGKHGLKKPTKTIDCGNSGTTMRLLAGLLAAQPFDSQLTGDESLLRRPMSRISIPLRQMGADISTVEGRAPLIIKGTKRLTGIEYLMPEASAQVKSSILLAGLYAEGETGVIEQGVSRNHTELMLECFGYPVSYSENSIKINSSSELKATELFIPGDISSAAFFIVAATIIPDSDIRIMDVGINPTRTGIIDILLKMGADITVFNQRQEGKELVADIQVRYSSLKGIDIPQELVPLAIDEFPIICIAAACAQGRTLLTEGKELRFKESDRIAAMIDGLICLGIKAQALDDGLIIEGGTFQGGEVDSLGDHRIAMSFLIAGAVAPVPVLVKNCANITTSFPLFVETAKTIQLQIEDVAYNV